MSVKVVLPLLLDGLLYPTDGIMYIVCQSVGRARASITQEKMPLPAMLWILVAN